MDHKEPLRQPVSSKLLAFLVQAPVANKWEQGETRFRVRSDINPLHSDVRIVVKSAQERKSVNKDKEEKNTHRTLTIPSSISACSFATVSSHALPVVNAMVNGSFFSEIENEGIKTEHPIGNFYQDDTVSGSVIIAAKDGWTHNGVYLTILGDVTFPRVPSNQIIDQLLEPEKAIQQERAQIYQRQKFLKTILPPRIRFIELCIPLLPKGKIAFGVHEIPFSFPLEPCSNMFQTGASNDKIHLLETFHGDRIRIDYTLNVCIDRGVFSRPIDSRLEIKVEEATILGHNAPNASGKIMNQKEESTKLTLSPAHIDPYSSSGSTTATFSDLEVPHFGIEADLKSNILDLSDPFIRGRIHFKGERDAILFSSIAIILWRREIFFSSKNDIADEHKSTVAMAVCSDLEEHRHKSIEFQMNVPDIHVSPTFCHLPQGPKLPIGFEVNYLIEVVAKMRNGRKARLGFPIKVYRSRSVDEPSKT